MAMTDIPPPALVQPAAPDTGSAGLPVQIDPADRRPGLPVAPVKPSQPGTGVPLTANPRLFGDWGGALPRLKRIGLVPTLSVVTETAANANGGTRRDATLVWQVNAGLTADLTALTHLPGTIQITITKRDGASLNQTAGLNFLQFPQGTFGRGRISRLTSAFYQVRFGGVDVKAGRVSPGDDFNAARGDFMSLYLVGSATGHIVPNIWYNFPVGEWGVRVRGGFVPHQTVQAGLYQVTPRSIDPQHGWYLGTGGGNTGILAPVEWQIADPFGTRLPGLVKIGGFYSNVPLPDPARNVSHGVRAATGLPEMMHRGHTGIFANLRQQLALPRADGAHAVSLFFNGAWVSRHASTVERKLAAGISLTGAIPGRPTDELALGVADGRVNDRITDAQRLLRAATLSNVPVRTSERMIELYYGIDVTPGLVVRPDVQLWFHPTGDARLPMVAIFGLKTVATL